MVLLVFTILIYKITGFNALLCSISEKTIIESYSKLNVIRYFFTNKIEMYR